MNAAERALIDGIKKGLYKEQERYYLSYIAAFDWVVFTGASKEDAARLIGMAIEENQKDIEVEAKAARQSVIDFLEEFLRKR